MRSAGRASTTDTVGSPDPALWAAGKVRLEGLPFRRAPLLAAAVWFALGEMMARYSPMVPLPRVFLLIALMLLSGFAIMANRWALRVVLVPLAGAWMVAGLVCADIQPTADRQVELIHYADGLSRRVHGSVIRVRTLPARVAADQDADKTQWQEQEEPAGGALSVDIAVDSVEEVTPNQAWMAPTSGGVRVTIVAPSGALPDLRCGDVIEAPMRLKQPERYRDPGAWQYANFLLGDGIGVRANVQAAPFKRLGRGTATAQCRIFAAQAGASERIDKFVDSSPNGRLPSWLQLSREDGAMLKAMLFGDRAGLGHAQRIGFERTGSFHLFVVSGLHVTLLAGGVFWLMRRFRMREGMATIVTLGATAAYAVLTGFGAPVQRALGMTAIFLVARLLSRDRNALNGLGAAALAVLIWSPGSLFEASFQMTFLAVVAIAGIAVPLGERSLMPYAHAVRDLRSVRLDFRARPRVAQFRVMLRMWGQAFADAFGDWAFRVPGTAVASALWLGEVVLLGLVVEAVMVLPMAVYFHRATPLALPANMLSVPLIAVLAPMGILTFVTGLLSPWLAMIPAAGTAMLLHGIRGVVGTMGQIGAAEVRVPAPAGWVMMAAGLSWAVCCWAVRQRRKAWAWGAVALLPVIAAMVLWPEPALVTPGLLEVTAIDVGQGDSLLVIGPDGRTMLVDAGGPVGSLKETSEAQAGFDVGEQVVSPYLWSRRIRRLDVMVLSHAHSDHMGGMAAVMRDFRPRELWVGIDANSDVYRALLAETAELGIAVRHYRAEDALVWGGVDVKVLSPGVEYENSSVPKNDDSLVLRLEYGRASVLLEGDAEGPSERAMLAGGLVTPVTLLKVGHHGSLSSTSEVFLAAAAPRDAVVSVGKGNTFGHPRGEVIQRMARDGVRLYRTDEFGLITFLLTKEGQIREVVEGDGQP